MFKYRTKTAIATCLLAAMPTLAHAELKVIASIKPVHSLVSAVMKGAGDVELMVDGNASPHDYALRPSQAKSLSEADLVFWVSPALETFLAKPIETIGAKAKPVALIDSQGIIKLPYREGASFEAHDHDHHAGHDDHGHEKHADHDDDKHDDHDHDDHDHDHDDHDHDKHEGHDHEKHADHEGHDHEKHADHDGHDHDKHAKHDDHDHAGHAHGADGIDPHIFLDPVNAQAMVRKIKKTLVKVDPENKSIYKKNAAKLEKNLDALIVDTKQALASVTNPKFIVFHDAYHYYEARFGVEASGAITLAPEAAPSIARVKEVRGRIQELGASCVFTEPQFPTKLVDTVTEGTQAERGTLDPLGSNIESGPDLYFDLITNMTGAFVSCLSKQG